MKIGYLIPEFPGQTHVLFWREIRALRTGGTSVHIVSTRKPRPITCRHEFALPAARETFYLVPPSLRLLCSRDTFRVLRNCRIAAAYFRSLSKTGGLSARARFLGLFIAALNLTAWARRNGIEHVHVHSCADAAHVVAMAYRLGGPPFSLTLHGDLDVYGRDHDIKMADAAFVSVVGTHLQEQLLTRTRVTADRILTSFMGIEIDSLAALGADRKPRQRALHFVTVARLNPMKGHLHALRAMRRGLDAGLQLHYTIAGEGPNEQSLRASVKELSLDEHVTFTGTLAEADVLRLLSRTDAFVLPSIGLGEAWPVSVMEAMAAGLPVIASRIGATPEMITSGFDGILVSQGDEAAILDALSQLANDPDFRESLGKQARHTAAQRFSVAASTDALLNAIRSRQAVAGK